MTNPNESADELVEAAEQRLQASEKLRHELDSLTAIAENADRKVKVKVNTRGQLIDLRLHPSAARYEPTELARQIEITTTRAAEKARQASYDAIALALGDTQAAALETVAGESPARSRHQ